MRGLFVTGTDTGVGKTFVTAGLARLLRRQGRTVRVCKPTATGGDDGVSADAELLAEAAGEPDSRLVTPWVYAAPVAPSAAARLEGKSLDLARLAAFVRSRWTEDAVLLVEGVGGLCCPLTDAATVADLARELGLPLLVVARRSLGTLSHTLLTLETAAARGLAAAGVIVSATTPIRGVAEETCIETLRPHLRAPLLAVLPHLEHPTAEAAATALAGVDWQALLERKAVNGSQVCR